MTRDQLIASLTATTDTAGWFADDGRYADWSEQLADGGRRLEAGTDTEAIQLDLSRADLVALHQALTLTLLADED